MGGVTTREPASLFFSPPAREGLEPGTFSVRGRRSTNSAIPPLVRQKFAKKKKKIDCLPHCSSRTYFRFVISNLDLAQRYCAPGPTECDKHGSPGCLSRYGNFKEKMHRGVPSYYNKKIT